MKLKISSKIIAAVSGLALALRTLQIFTVIDKETGFYKVDKNGIGVFLTVSVAVLCAVCAIVAKNSDAELSKTDRPNLINLIISGVAALTLFYELFSEKIVTNGFSWQIAALKITGLLAAAYFVLLVISPFLNFAIPEICHTFPAFYMVIRIICSFINISSLSLIAENIFLIAAYCCLLLFFITYASQKCRLDLSDTSLYMRGVLCFIVCLVTSLPNLIVNMTSLGGYSHIPLSSQVVLTALTVFVGEFTYKKFLK